MKDKSIIKEKTTRKSKSIKREKMHMKKRKDKIEMPMKQKQEPKSMKGLIRLLVLVLGIVLLLWFLMPFTVAGILNIGNITGMLLAVLFVLYVVFMPRIHRWIKSGWKRKGLRRIIALLGSLILLYGILVIVETGCMIGACNKAPEKNATAVVLGCRVYGERASLMLRERLDAAYEYLEKNPEAMCVVSGGQGSGEDISEAECMYRYLVAKGIESMRIYKEDQSTSTEENMKLSLEVIKENALDEKVVIISNEFHLYRAGRLAKDCNLSYGTVPAHTAKWLLPTYYVRELYAILAEWVF